MEYGLAYWFDLLIIFYGAKEEVVYIEYMLDKEKWLIQIYATTGVHIIF